MNIIRLDLSQRDNLINLRNRVPCSHGHQWVEIAARQAVAQVSEAISTMSPYEREVSGDRPLIHIAPAIDDPSLFPFGQFGTVASWCKEPGKARAARTQALGQCALWYHLDLDLDLAIAMRTKKVICASLRRERCNQAADAPMLEKTRQAGLASAGVVCDDSEILQLAPRQYLAQPPWHADIAESSHEDGTAGCDHTDGLFE